MSNNLNIKMLWLTMSRLILKTHLPFTEWKERRKNMNNKFTSLIYCFCSLNGVFRGKENSLKRIRRRGKAVTESEPNTLKFISKGRKETYH